MEKRISAQEIRELELQLSCPTGQNGIEIAKKMNESNIEMTKNSIQFLDIKNNDFILELGHGNCGHLELILDKYERVKYHGLEISDTMYREAQKINLEKQAIFHLYDGQNIPYPDNYFSSVFSVNTIYFWSKPEDLLSEITRVLKPAGVIVLTYANKSFMKNLPFVGSHFNLIDTDDLIDLVSKTNLKIIESIDKSDTVESKSGDTVHRTYTMVKIKK